MTLRVYLGRLSWLFLTVAGTLSVAGFIGAWSDGAGFLLFLLLLPALALGLATSGLIYFVRGVKLSRQRDRPLDRATFVLGTPVVMLAAIGAALPALATGGFLGSWARMMVNRSDYTRIIAEVESGRRHPASNSSLEEFGGIRYKVDAGPPVRVAFHPEGFLDNWGGIIFDPTGAVMLADGFDAQGRFTAPEAITKLFGGDLLWCQPLGGAYYNCGFT